MPKPNPNRILEITHGSWKTQVLYAAVSLGLFTLISEGKNTAKDIAAKIGSSEDAISRLLNACAGLGLLAKKDGKYENTPDSEEYLVKSKPHYLGDLVLMIGSDLYKLWGELADVVKTGTSRHRLSERMKDPEAAKGFTRAMHNNAMAPAHVMAEKIDFADRKKLLDIGGGSGTYSITLTQKYPDLHAVIYELPNVVKVADGYIAEANADRVETMDGDFHTDDLPTGYDAALISQILHSYSPETCRTIIAKAQNALADGGLLIINEFLLNDDKAGPEYTTLFSLNMLLESRGKGSSYTFAEISKWLMAAGFKNIKRVPLSGPHVAITAEK